MPLTLSITENHLFLVAMAALLYSVYRLDASWRQKLSETIAGQHSRNEQQEEQDDNSYLNDSKYGGDNRNYIVPPRMGPESARGADNAQNVPLNLRQIHHAGQLEHQLDALDKKLLLNELALAQEAQANKRQARDRDPRDARDQDEFKVEENIDSRSEGRGKLSKEQAKNKQLQTMASLDKQRMRQNGIVEQDEPEESQLFLAQ